SDPRGDLGTGLRLRGGAGRTALPWRVLHVRVRGSPPGRRAGPGVPGHSGGTPRAGRGRGDQGRPRRRAGGRHPAGAERSPAGHGPAGAAGGEDRPRTVRQDAGDPEPLAPARARPAGERVSAGRPKVLFLSQTLPYPPDGGVKIRTYHVLRQLARAFEVTALCFYRWKPGAHEPDVAEAVRALGAFGRVEAFPIPQEHSGARLLWDHLRSAARARVYTAYVYDSAEFRGRLRALLASERFDLVHADSLDLSAYFPLIGGLPLVCVHHDVQSVLLRRRAQRERSRARRAYLAFQANLMEREERRWCGRVALNVAVSEVDRAALLRLAPEARVTVVPNGVD